MTDDVTAIISTALEGVPWAGKLLGLLARKAMNGIRVSLARVAYVGSVALVLVVLDVGLHELPLARPGRS